MQPDPAFDMDLDFAGDRYWGDGAHLSLADVCSVNRATSGMAPGTDGQYRLFAPHTPRRTDMGLWIETGRSTIVPQLSRRDLTGWNAAGIRAACDQTGIDGAANAATRITALTANGVIKLPLAAPSESHVTSAFVRRLSGDGPLYMTEDGGLVWERAEAVRERFTRMIFPGRPYSCPGVGFRIGQAGDAFAIDYVQVEVGARVLRATTPIPNEMGNRMIDLASLNVSGRFAPLFRSPRLTVLVEFLATQAFSVGGNVLQLDDGSRKNRLNVNFTHFNKHSGLSVFGNGVGRGYDPLSRLVDSEETYHCFGFSIDMQANRLLVALNGEVRPPRAWTIPWPDPGLFTTLRWGTNMVGTPLNGAIRRFRVQADFVGERELARLMGSQTQSHPFDFAPAAL